ncbi:WXG100 family type VII secretion target [Bacillus sp. DX1.1]|uniref:WXG100 family type VII secretion target n=1 Tax=unclassified Bacillus (in: firmicutes) TaxID=185979 RepID=UPI002570A9D9|nr:MULTISPECIES: WXG100 family type VII secretion target [unclassified Bacillus (in: firmicutes)]MDM5156205.1 WXG100 family type VII secretion target [Bacillus sp. DX1.1]WJE80485.1 WXG100 family type VII secretion target [Bacillus sp. DX3.1]
MSSEIKVTPAHLRKLASNIEHTAHELSETYQRINQQLLNLPFQVSGRDAVLNQSLYAGSKLATVTDGLKEHSDSLRKAADRFEKADQEEVSFGEGTIDFNLLAPFGGDIDDWKDNPMGSSFTLLGTLTEGAAAYKLASLHQKGLRATTYTNKQGKEMVRVQNRTLLKDKNGNNIIRRTKLPLNEAKQIDDIKRHLLSPKEFLKDSLKLKTNALGYAAVAWDVVNDTKENIENKASTSKIAGDIIGDAAIGVGTTAVSAFAGAKAGALIGTAFGGPIGTVAGAATGFVISVGASIVLDGIKFKKGDWNNDNKEDSLKDRIKSGIGSTLDKIF